MARIDFSFPVDIGRQIFGRIELCKYVSSPVLLGVSHKAYMAFCPKIKLSTVELCFNINIIKIQQVKTTQQRYKTYLTRTVFIYDLLRKLFIDPNVACC